MDKSAPVDPPDSRYLPLDASQQKLKKRAVIGSRYNIFSGVISALCILQFFHGHRTATFLDHSILIPSSPVDEDNSFHFQSAKHLSAHNSTIPRDLRNMTRIEAMMRPKESIGPPRFADIMSLSSKTPAALLTTIDFESTSPKANTQGRFRTEPQILFDEYKQQHSHESLLRDNETNSLHHRSYILGVYTCPYQAGNRLHDFTAAVVAAILTNRTLLWKYYDPDTCSALGNFSKTGLWCGHLGSYEECHQIIDRANWIPSYSDWALSLGMNPKVSYNGRRPQGGNYRHNDTLFIPFDMVTAKEPGIWKSGGYLRYHSFAGKRLNVLYKLGTMYLFGMIFHEVFPIKPYVKGSPLLPSEVTNTKGKQGSPITISVHSRHGSRKDDGKNVTREKGCLLEIFEVLSVGLAESSKVCFVHLMSDRELTINLLSEWILESTTCTPIIAMHEKGKGLTKEHGPYAGKGYFDDLSEGRQARDGFVGSCKRSSSQLLWELIEYDRVEHAIASNVPLSSLSKLATCCL